MIDRIRLPAEPASASAARSSAMAYAADAGAGPDTVADVALVVSELVTNAAAAACGEEIELRIDARGSTLHVEVDDDGPGRPVVIRGSERGGYGLVLLEAICRAWGCVEHGVGKTTWADVPLDRAGG